jgi:hypothetical protein
MSQLSAKIASAFLSNASAKFLGRFMVSVKSGLPAHLWFLLWIDSGRGDRDQESCGVEFKTAYAG